jgi:filamentous hemagglutinin family protein
MKLQTAIILALTLYSYSFGNPGGEIVVSGTVGFETTGSTLNITASDRAIIEWQDFSIDAGETTRFIQPSVSAAVLNQVTSDIPSSIFGNLLSNGNVYLMNSNGIVIGASGVIDTGGFLATTLDQGTSRFFENGQLELLGDSDAAIVNLGNITATGDIFLVAAKIDNQGLIHSTNGFVGLAAGKDVLLKESGEERIFHSPSWRR